MREIVHNVKLGANLLRGLPLDHVRDRLAREVQKRLDVQEVSSLREEQVQWEERNAQC